MFDLMVIAVVQIIIESLPISSSAHVLIVQHVWTKLTGETFLEVPAFFNDFLQGPTVFVIAVVFFKDWFSSAQRLFSSGWKFIMHQRLCWSERKLWGVFGTLLGFVCVADVMTMLAYGIKKFMDNGELHVTPLWVLAVNFTVSMVGLLSLRVADKECEYSRLSMGKSILLGATQGLALLCPGLSRFGSTYVVGRWLRLSPRRAFQFSFLIQFPLIFAAFIIKGLPGVPRAFFTLPIIGVLVGSTVIAGFLFAWAYRLALARKLWRFGVYMIIPITILLILIWFS